MKDEKEIRVALDSYDKLKLIIEGADQEVNEVFVDIVKATLKWVLNELEDDIDGN